MEDHKRMKKNHRILQDYFWIILLFLLLLQTVTAVYFGVQKKGFHYDEYYSYYSSNLTYGLAPGNMEWKNTDEIKSEFMTLPGEGFRYGLVSLMQTYDVHPPLYYFVLHTVSSLSPGVFSKWQGFTVNLLFFLLSWMVLYHIAALVTNRNRRFIVALLALFGFSPAIYSAVTFMRMYMMLTFFCLLLLLLHIRVMMQDKMTFAGFFLPLIVIVFLGSMTHYYYIVFLFFVAFAFFCILLFAKEGRKHLAGYTACILSGLLLFVIVYPKSLSHIFRGYRGTEAMSAFLDVGNMKDRLAFFLGLTNKHIFGNTMYLWLLVFVLCMITNGCLLRLNRAKTMAVSDEAAQQEMLQKAQKKSIIMIAVSACGYFLVVAKTALLNGEEAVRYEMPVYPLFIFLFLWLGQFFLYRFKGKGGEMAKRVCFPLLVGLTLTAQIYGLCTGSVQFLYPEDDDNIKWAASHKTDPVVYVYNPVNEWMIWDDAQELMQYSQIYFISMEEESDISDAIINQASCIYLYSVRNEKGEALMEQIIHRNTNLHSAQKIRELQYCDLYELK